MTKITIEHGGLKSVFEWQEKIEGDMADALREAIRAATGEPDMSTLIWAIAKIRLATGVNEKPMLSELPDAISDLMDKRNRRIRHLESELAQIATDATEYHADWIEIGPDGTAARDFAFAIADYATKALGANND